MLTAETVLVRADHCLTSELDTELVMMDAERGSYFSLNAVGREVWNRLDQPVKIGDLCTSLGQSYDAPPEVIARDVLTLLEAMVSENLVKIAA